MHEDFGRFAIAAGLGLLVGLQRQHQDVAVFAGLRTFPVVAIFGFLCAISGSPVVIAAGLAATALLVAITHWMRARDTLTTEFTLLAVYSIGAATAAGYTGIAVASATVIAILLEFKGELHGIVARLRESDIKAILQFAVISLLVLPMAPDRTLGPYAVLNPRQIWWMVVLIVGLNLGGYLANKFLDSPNKGLLLTGLLGGFVSSTATTASYSRAGGDRAVPVILIAGAVVYVRLAMEVLSTAPQLAWEVLPRLALPFAALSVWAFIDFRKATRASDSGDAIPAAKRPTANPAELRIALAFAVGYAFVLLINSAAKDLLGDRGVFAVSILGGLTDVDAITLSTTQMVNVGRLSTNAAWQSILIASLSNLVFKTGIGFVLGGPKFGTRIGYASGSAILASSLAWLVP
jgi:uncharacterized membrane protein (DUF4010 family)